MTSPKRHAAARHSELSNRGTVRGSAERRLARPARRAGPPRTGPLLTRSLVRHRGQGSESVERVPFAAQLRGPRMAERLEQLDRAGPGLARGGALAERAVHLAQ